MARGQSPVRQRQQLCNGKKERKKTQLLTRGKAKLITPSEAAATDFCTSNSQLRYLQKILENAN